MSPSLIVLVLVGTAAVQGQLLGAGSGQNSCSAPPYRSRIVQYWQGCPAQNPCCTEYGYCRTQEEWMRGEFRDCNGASNGLQLPASTVNAEQTAAYSGDNTGLRFLVVPRRGIFGSIAQTVGGIAQGINTGFQGTVSGIGNGISGIFQGTGSAVGGIVNGAGSAVGGVASGLGGAVGGVASGAGQAVGGVASGAGQAVGGVANGVGGAIGGTATGVGGAFGGVASGVGGVVGGVAQGTGQVIGGVAQGTGQVVGGVASGVGSGVGGVASGVGGAVGGVAHGAGSAVGGVAHGTGHLVGGVAHGTGAVIGGAASGAGNGFHQHGGASQWNGGIRYPTRPLQYSVINPISTEVTSPVFHQTHQTIPATSNLCYNGSGYYYC